MTEANILLVDDDPGSIQALSRMLSGQGRFRFATSGSEALRLARESVPDLVLLDAEMPGMSGFQVCAAMKADPLLADVPVIFVTSHSEPDFEVSGLALGAVDFIAKPMRAPLVVARVQTHLRLKHTADELRQRATIDALTGVANRRLFDETLAREWLRVQRSGRPISLLMIDVDFFKRFNDRYGHASGDECLRALARALQQAMRRPGDLLARYGGEEFVALLPDTPAAGARHVAQVVLAAIAALAIPHADSSVARHVTASVGVASFDASSRAWSEPSPGARSADELARPLAAALLLAADRALYSAKHAGRAQGRYLAFDDAHDAQRAAPLAAAPTPA